MKNIYMNEKELNVKVGDTVSVWGNRGTVIEVVKGFDTEWNGTEYVKADGSDFTNVRVHFTGELANWGQYQDGEYGMFEVIETAKAEIDPNAIKKDFQKVIKAIRDAKNKECGTNSEFPKAMMTRQQIAKGTATVNCGGEWGSLEGTTYRANKVMNDERFTEFLTRWNATAKIEMNSFGTAQIRINY